MLQMTLVIVTLAALISLVLDVGNLYFQYLNLYSASDAAAISGATYLPLQPAAAQATAQTIALTNGIKASEIQSIVVSPDSRKITVTTNRTVPVFFAALLGLKNFVVGSTSTAGVQAAGSNLRGVLPLGVDNRTPFTVGQIVVLRGDVLGPGNWGGLALGGTGGQNYRTNIEVGYPGTLSIGDDIQTEPGAKPGPTAQGVTTRILAGLTGDPLGTWSSHSLDDVRAAVVPVVDWQGAQGRSDVVVTGFTQVWLLAAAGNDVTGIVISQAVNGAPSPGAPDNGALHVALLN